jgi:hypothetical protein
MIVTVAIVLLVLWLLGFIGNFGGSLIHALLIIGIVAIIYDVINRRRAI